MMENLYCFEKLIEQKQNEVSEKAHESRKYSKPSHTRKFNFIHVFDSFKSKKKTTVPCAASCFSE